MSEHLGWLHDSDGWKIVDPSGHAWEPDDYQLELESQPKAAALDVPTIDVEPESVRDTEIHREIES